MLLTDARRAARTGPRRRADPARRAGPHALGPRAIAEGVALVTAALSRGSVGAVPAAGGDRGRARRGGARRRTPTGRRSSRSTACSSGCPTTRWSRSTTRSRSRWCTARRRGSTLLEPLDADARIAGHHRLDAVRAHLLERAGESAAPSRTTAAPRSARRASPSATTS